MESDNKDKIIAKLSMRIIYLSLLLFVLMLIGLVYIFWTPTIPDKKVEFICGNAVLEQQQRENIQVKYGTDVDQGQKLFKQNCAVCHTLGKNTIIGPGLQGIATRIPSQKWLMSYLSNYDSILKSGDLYTRKLRSTFPTKISHQSLTLTDSQVKEIIGYISTTPSILY